jgi:hypothetical protein
VHDSYGKKCNQRFLLNYGFALPQVQTGAEGVTGRADTRGSDCAF